MILLLLISVLVSLHKAERKCASACRVSNVVNLWHATAQRSHLTRALQGCGDHIVESLSGFLVQACQESAVHSGTESRVSW